MAASPEVRQSEIDPERSRALLSRVVNSQELKRSSRLRELMQYLGNRSLDPHSVSIREQEIGTAVFGRPEDYDTNIDNIVRVNVSELRKRLAHYFQEEGAGESLILEIPRGGYLPLFVTRPVAELMPVALPVPSLDESETTPASTVERPAESLTGGRALASSSRSLVAAAILLALALGACGYLVSVNHTLRGQLRPWQADRTMAAFWSQFFGTGEEVDIVTADTSYALAQDLLARPISLDDYLDYKYKSFGDMPGVAPEKRDALNLALDRDTGSVGDFDAAKRVMDLDAHTAAIKLASARDFTPQGVKNNNVILLGSSESNPWVNLYKDRLNFVVEYDQAHHHSYVQNRNPLPGERSVYEVQGDRDHEYSTLAFLPNMAEHRYTLIIAGTNSQGTRAAGEFVTSPEGLAGIRQRLPVGRYPYFEVLLSSSGLRGTTLHTSIEAARGYDR
jgi:hypothetical protein